MISLTEARKLNRRGNVIPLFERIPADLDTPVSAYMKLIGRSRDSFLLESVEGGEKLARYSFLGCDPFLIVEGDASGIILKQKGKTKRIDADPIDFLREMFSFYKPVAVESLPRFTGGAVGYFGYDAIRLVEDIPDENPDEIGLSDLRLAFFSRIVVFDHLRQEIIVIANLLHEKGQPGFDKKYRATKARVEAMVNRLQKPLRMPRRAPATGKRPRLKAHYEKPEFEKLVRRAKKYIKEGDIFQAVLSQRWHVDSGRSALSVYRRLRRINPSPYTFLLRMGDNAIIGASPEMMTRVEGGSIEVRPIAGTRPRGKNDADDSRLAADLLADPKEVAEHTMLLDLGRNDIGRVAEAGTVTIGDKMIVEKYSHVIHLVSSVSGRLSSAAAPIEGHFACFPAGTVSGAPKIRAMEIIDELEKERRGVYAGSVAYLDFWGNLDSCIAIRTIVKKKRRFYLQAGAGIVADSKPAREFRETEAKARALVEAVIGDAS